MPATSFAVASPDVGSDGSAIGQHTPPGPEHDGAGTTDSAISAAGSGLAAAEAPGSPSVDATAKLRVKLGDAAMLGGDFEAASLHYRTALQMAPHLADGWCNFATLHFKAGKVQDAIALYLQALRRSEEHTSELQSP